MPDLTKLHPPVTVGPLARQSLAAQQTTANLAFLTRPYTTWHWVTSVFDHCSPDYSADGKVCRFDGSIGLKSNGADPSFPLGYAQTPGGTDYLYYDGHNGWDYGLNYENVLAAADGTVRLAGTDSINPCFGQTIIVDHPNGFSTRYAHLSQIFVVPGQAVLRGQVIATSGNTGCSSGPHLHFGVYITSSWTAIDPWGWWGAPATDPWPDDPGDLWLTGEAQFPLPWAPTGVAATPGNESAIISWTVPGFDGGTAITGYRVTASPGGKTLTVDGAQTRATMTGLTNGTSYTFSVTAMNRVGSGPASAASNSVIPVASPDPLPVLSAATLDFGTRTLFTHTAKAVQLSNIGGTTLAISAIFTSGDYSEVNDCGVGLPSLQTCTITVNFTPTTFGPREGTLTLQDNAPGNQQSVGLTGTGVGWASPEIFPGPVTSAPDVASWAAGRLDVFARGADGSLVHKWYDGQNWSGWESLGGYLASGPGAVSWASGRLDVFVQGADNALWHRWYDGGSTGAWHDWESLGGVITAAPDVASWGAGRLDVVARGGDNALWHIWYDGGRWHPWKSYGGILASDPTAVSWASGRLDVFAGGADGGLWHIWYDNEAWHPWESLGGKLSYGPDAAAWSAGRLDVFSGSADSRLIHMWYDSGGWHGWEVLPDQLVSGPAAVSWAQGRIDVFAETVGGNLLHTWYD